MRDTNQVTQGNQLVAFFTDESDALSTISQLKEAGFTSDQIGLASASRDTMDSASVTGRTSGATHIEDNRSTWDKMKDFFRGEHESYTGQPDDYENTFAHLSVAGDRARYYTAGISAGGALVTVRAEPDRLEIARAILVDNDADLRTEGFDRLSETETNAGHETERRVQLRGELLRAVKERIQTGEIRLRKDVVTENQSINVPVTREEVIVERVSAEEAGSGAGINEPIGEGKEIRIPVTEERVSVIKDPVVTGEVRVQKRAVQDTQQVSDTVRREEVRVENEGNATVKDRTNTGQKKPAA
jgi:uncharacterized protein (TIGR02271 family)